ncbi:cupin domain-containing protein, partial [Streptomyces nigra]
PEEDRGAPPAARRGEERGVDAHSAVHRHDPVSPPHMGLRAELVEGRLGPGADIAYDRPPVPGLEQHVWVLDGVLEVTVQEIEYPLEAGDCLRTRVWGPTRFRCPGPGEVRYLLAVVLP